MRIDLRNHAKPHNTSSVTIFQHLMGAKQRILPHSHMQCFLSQDSPSNALLLDELREAIAQALGPAGDCLDLDLNNTDPSVN